MSNKIVYFAGAIRGDRSMEHVMLELVRYIQAQGLKVLTEHVATADPVATLATYLGKRKEDLTAEDIETQDIAWLDTATHVIAEISGPSTGTGREVEYARTKGQLGKTPANVLCIYHDEHEYTATPMIRGMSPEKYPNVSVAKYHTTDEAKEIIKKFLQTE